LRKQANENFASRLEVPAESEVSTRRPTPPSGYWLLAIGFGEAAQWTRFLCLPLQTQTVVCKAAPKEPK